MASRRGASVAHEREHRAVVVRIGVAIEEVGSAGGVELGQQRRVPTLADVHHAGQHRPIFTGGAVPVPGAPCYRRRYGT